MKNWWPPAELYNKGMLFWFGVAMFLPLLILFSSFESCRAEPLDKQIIKREITNSHISKLPLASLSENTWIGGGYQKWDIPCTNQRNCQEWVWESSAINWGLEITSHLNDTDSEAFISLNIGSKVGLIKAFRDKINPLGKEGFSLFVSFNYLFS